MHLKIAPQLEEVAPQVLKWGVVLHLRKNLKIPGLDVVLSYFDRCTWANKSWHYFNSIMYENFTFLVLFVLDFGEFQKMYTGFDNFQLTLVHFIHLHAIFKSSVITFIYFSNKKWHKFIQGLLLIYQVCSLLQIMYMLTTKWTIHTTKLLCCILLMKSCCKKLFPVPILWWRGIVLFFCKSCPFTITLCVAHFGHFYKW